MIEQIMVLLYHHYISNIAAAGAVDRELIYIILACSCRYIDKEVEQDRSRVRIEQVLAPSMQLSGRGSQEQRSIGTSFAPLQAMMNDGEIGVE